MHDQATTIHVFIIPNHKITVNLNETYIDHGSEPWIRDIKDEIQGIFEKIQSELLNVSSKWGYGEETSLMELTPWLPIRA